MKFITNILKDVKNKLVILDNGQIHKKEETKNIIKKSGNNLLYTNIILYFYNYYTIIIKI
jgi:hypothetical protein